MIVVSRPLVLSPAAAAVSLVNPRIGWQNRARNDAIDATKVTVSSEAAEGPRDAPLRPDTAEYWLPASLPATWLVDLVFQYDVDYVGLVHTLGSSRCAVLAETSQDASVWTPIAAETMPATDAPLMLLGTLRSARYLRLTFTGAVPPRIAAVYVGQALAMMRAIAGGYKPITMSRETVLVRSLSRGGQFLGQGFRRNGVQGSAAFKYLDAAWVRANFDPFSKSARQYPYFMAWNPQSFPNEVAYVWTDADIVPGYTGVIDQMDVSWSMQGVGLE